MKTTLRHVVALALAALCACAVALAQEAARRAREDSPAASVVSDRDDAPAPGSIKGRVMDDAGRPVPDFVVMVSGRSGVNRNYAVTDESGNFSIDGLEPGLYNFSFLSQGYVVVNDPATGDNSFGSGRVGDFVNIRLARGGVITGTVTDAEGQPVIAVPVRAFFVRRLEDSRGVPTYTNAREFQTDDRGVFRIYGLRSGVYVVSSGGTPQFRGGPLNPFERDAPTYFPSSTRDNAAEVVVREGQEAAGIDIRYRGERGHAVSGTIEGLMGANAEQLGINPMLVHAATGTIQGQTYISGRELERGFVFDGVSDGEYELIARRFGRADGDFMASAPLKVNVRGADVTGLKLTLAPLAVVGGSVVIEPLPTGARETSVCAVARTLLPEEISVSVRRDESDLPKGQTPSRLSTRGMGAAADTRGRFTIRGIDPGRYRVDARPGSEDWYVRTIRLGQPPAPKRAGAQKVLQAKPPNADAAPSDFLQLTAGRKISDVRVTVAEGAASLRGRVVAVDGSAGVEASSTPHARTRVHLVPAERERADDLLRYHESATDADGSFRFINVAPGRYLILTRADADTATLSRTPAAWDADSRRTLRREAEAANVPVELQTCQRITDFALRLPQTGSK